MEKNYAGRKGKFVPYTGHPKSTEFAKSYEETMSDKFENLRQATQGCINQHGASRNEELFEFRNAVTVTVIDQLLRDYDHLREQATLPTASHTFGDLTSAEAALLHAFRQADDDSKSIIQRSVKVLAEMAESRESKVRCDVVDIASARLPIG